MTYDLVRKRSILYGGRDGVNGGSVRKTWEYVYKPPAKASFSPFGTGCPTSVGTPQLAAVQGSVPMVGGTFSLDLTSLPTSVLVRATGLIGATNTMWGSLPLPFGLQGIGMPGCQLLVSSDFSPQTLNISNGTARWDLPIPNNPALAGGIFHLQALVFLPGTNAFGAVVSNAGTASMGY